MIRCLMTHYQQVDNIPPEMYWYWHLSSIYRAIREIIFEYNEGNSCLINQIYFIPINQRLITQFLQMDCSTSDSSSCISILRGLLIASQAQVITPSVHNKGSSDDCVRPIELNNRVSHLHIQISITVSHHVAQVTHMPVGISLSAVCVLEEVTEIII